MKTQKFDDIVCEYKMFTDNTQKRWHSFGVNNNGTVARFSINGQEVIASREIEDEVLEALTKLDTALCKLAVNRLKIEEM